MVTLHEEVLIKFTHLSDRIVGELTKQKRQGKVNKASGRNTRKLFREINKLYEQYRKISVEAEENI